MLAEQLADGIDGVLPSRHAMIDAFSVGDGFGIGATARVLAFAALGLGKQIFDGICHGNAFDGRNGHAG